VRVSGCASVKDGANIWVEQSRVYHVAQGDEICATRVYDLLSERLR
jgi:hypothetical protein